MGLKVFDLQCGNGHVFEGWFRSDENYEHQLAQGLLSCPVCSDTKVAKQLSAPRLNLSHLRNKHNKSGHVPKENKPHGENKKPVTQVNEKQLANFQAKLLQQLRQVVQSADDVGDQFADEARRIHSGESKERSIRGVASSDDIKELHDEGIEVLPIPQFLDDEQLH